MIYIDIFEHFDPITGLPPKLNERSFEFVLKLARKLLSSRTSDEIAGIYESLQLMYMERGPYALEMEDHSEGHYDFPDVYKEHLTHISPAYDVLKLIMNKVDLVEEEYSDAEWYEYFAALALGKVAEACEEETHMNSTKTELHVTMTLGEATEAVLLAEYMHDKEKEIKKERVTRSKKALEKRNQHRNELIDELEKFYLDGDHSSYASAVAMFLEKVNENKVRHILPHNRHKRLSESLSKRIREKMNIQ